LIPASDAGETGGVLGGSRREKWVPWLFLLITSVYSSPRFGLSQLLPREVLAGSF